MKHHILIAAGAVALLAGFAGGASAHRGHDDDVIRIESRIRDRVERKLRNLDRIEVRIQDRVHRRIERRIAREDRIRARVERRIERAERIRDRVERRIERRLRDRWDRPVRIRIVGDGWAYEDDVDRRTRNALRRAGRALERASRVIGDVAWPY